MIVPASANQVLTRQTPIAGDTAAVEQAASFVGCVSSDCVTYNASLIAASGQLLAVEGAATRRYRQKLDERLQVGSRALQQSADTAKLGFITYAIELEDIHRRARRVSENVDGHLGTIRAESAVIENIAAEIGCRVASAWNAPPSMVMPEPVLDETRGGGLDPTTRIAAGRALTVAYADEWRRAVTSWIGACAGIVDERTTWAGLIARRSTAEHRLVSTLRDTPLGQLISTGLGGGASGPKVTVAHGISGELWGVNRYGAFDVRTHPDLSGLFAGGDASGGWNAPPAPDAVAAWWRGLDDRARNRLVAEAPWVIGNLPGLPYGVRDRANRLLLEYYRVHRYRLSAQCQDALAAIVRVLNNDDGEPRVSLVSLDLHGRVPLAAVGYGELDTAQYLYVEGPGMFNDVERGLPGWDRASRNLYDEQERELRNAGRGGAETAMIAFLAYDTPNFATVLSAATAQSAAVRLAAEIDGGAATRGANTPLVNLGVIAHSYGTTVLVNALARTKHPVQSVVLVASAGLDGATVTSFDELNVDRDAAGNPKVYTTMAAQDAVAPFGSNLSGRLQPNPGSAISQEKFIGGAYSFSSDGYGEFTATAGHAILRDDQQGYFDAGTQSLNSTALISLGEADRVTGGLTRVDAIGPTVIDQLGQNMAQNGFGGTR